MKLSHSTIVPAEDQDFLIALRDRQTNIEWAVGDKANQIYDHPPALGVTRQQVYAAVGYYFGKPARTVRYYAETARYISPELREDYDNLPFGMFALACRPKFREAGQTEAILEWASLNNASIDQAEYRFEVKESDDEAYEEDLVGVKITTISYRDHHDLKDALSSVMNDFLGEEAPVSLRQRTHWHLNNMFSDIEKAYEPTKIKNDRRVQ